MKDATKTVFEILSKASERGYIGEPVSQLEHALQAAHFAKQYDSENSSLIVAALLHDIGHMIEGAQRMGKLGVMDHEQVGAEFLKKLGFKKEVYELVASHVAAKRYLVSKFDAYRGTLSEASQQTLAYQGGFMNTEEMNDFESHSLFKDFIKIRHFDDAAKKVDFEVPNLESYVLLLDQMCS